VTPGNAAYLKKAYSLMRTFIAMEIPQTIKSALAAMQQELRSASALL